MSWPLLLLGLIGVARLIVMIVRHGRKEGA